MTFDRKPAQKSQQEQEFDKLNRLYTERFGEPYRFSVGIDASSWDEVLADIRRCLDTDKKQPAPDYDLNYVY